MKVVARISAKASCSFSRGVPIIKALIFVLDTPHAEGTHFAADSYQLHGTSTPGAVLARMPPLVATAHCKCSFNARPVAGHEYL